MRQLKINKYFRVLLGDISIVPFLGPALVYLTGVGYIDMCLSSIAIEGE